LKEVGKLTKIKKESSMKEIRKPIKIKRTIYVGGKKTNKDKENRPCRK